MLKFICATFWTCILLCGFTVESKSQTQQSVIGTAKRINAQDFLKSSTRSLPQSQSARLFHLDLQSFEQRVRNGNMEILEFPVSRTENATIRIQRSELPFDQTTRFVTQSKQGELECAAPQICLWEGKIDAEPHSRIVLLRSELGMLCSIQRENAQVLSLCSDPLHPEELMLIADRDIPRQAESVLRCMSPDPLNQLPSKVTQGILENTLYSVDIALETDTRFYQACGASLNKAQSYAVAVLAMVNALYVSEISTRLHLSWIKTWTDSPADPYNCGGDPFVLRDRAMPIWDSLHKDVQRNMYQVMTSISYGGGGFGFLKQFCGDHAAMASSSLQVQHTLPTFSFTYDSYIVAHELGHNFGAPHTHSCDVLVPLDTCVVDASNIGKCLDSAQKALPNPGSIMSYCGGTNSAAGLGYQVRMTFLPPIASTMRQNVKTSSCVKILEAATIALASPQGSESYDVAKPINIRVSSKRVNNIDIFYSLDNGLSWIVIIRDHSIGNGEYSWQPPAICTNNVLMRVRSTDDTTVVDQSILPFKLYVSSPSDGLLAQYSFSKNYRNSVCGSFDDARAVEGSVSFMKDRFGAADSAIHIAGNGYLYVPMADLRSSQLSVSLWCSPDSINGKNTIIGTNYGPATNVFEIYHWGILGCSYYLNSGLWQFWSGGLNLKQWSHVVFSFDGTTAKTWLNNKLIKSESHSGTLIPFITTLYIGSRKGQEYFYGGIDDIRVYNRSLTDADVQQLYTMHDGATSVESESQSNVSTSSCIEAQIDELSKICTLHCSSKFGADVEVELYSLLGQSVYHHKLEATDAQFVSFSMPSLPKGSYILRTRSAGCQSSQLLQMP